MRAQGYVFTRVIPRAIRLQSRACRRTPCEMILVNTYRVSDLKTLPPAIEGEPAPLKTFKDYEPGFLHAHRHQVPATKLQ